MKVVSPTSRAIFVLVLCLVLAAGACSRQKSETRSAKPPRITIGYQTAWATAGQLIETLVHTSIPQLYGSNATFQTFLFGPDMNEAALSGSIDGTNTGLVPTIHLLAASDDWVIVCRLVDFPVSIVARNGSGVERIEDLKGKKLGVPTGGGSHPYVVQRLRDSKLPIGTGSESVELINLQPSEHIQAMKQGAVDAVGTWEPQTSKLVTGGVGRVIDEDRHVGFLTVSKKVAENYPQEVIALIESYAEANWYVAQHRKQTDTWFAARSGFTLADLASIKVIEPNLEARSIQEVKLELTDADLTKTQNVADEMLASGLIRRPLNIRSRANTTFSVKAMSELHETGSKAALIQLTNP